MAENILEDLLKRFATLILILSDIVILS